MIINNCLKSIKETTKEIQRENKSHKLIINGCIDENVLITSIASLDLEFFD